MLNNLLRCTVLLTFIWSVFGCYSRNEGCLDIYATNYEVNADEKCEMCCQYPALQLFQERFVGDSLYFQGDTLENQFGQHYVILGFRYYLSNFRIFQAGNELIVREVIQNTMTNEIIPDDIKIVSDMDANVNIGTIRTYGKFDSLQFVLGITPPFLNYDLNLPNGHVLTNLGRLNDASAELAGAALKIKYLSMQDTTFTVFLPPTFQYPYTIIDSLNMTKPGQAIVGKIKIDYKKMLEDVDLTLPYESIKTKLANNLPLLITVH